MQKLQAAQQYQRWTAAEIELLRSNFADSRTADLAQVLGRTYTAVAQQATRMGLSKSGAYLDSPAAQRLTGSAGMGTRFQPGQQPWNKGQKFDPGGRSAETRFQPGTMNGRAAQLMQPLGSYRINADGYLDCKISNEPGAQHRRWKAVHRLVWEAANGQVPEGHAVCFRPGMRTTDPEAITLDVLELVSRRELMQRNTVHRYGPEVASIHQLRGALTRQINQLTKKATP